MKDMNKQEMERLKKIKKKDKRKNRSTTRADRERDARERVSTYLCHGRVKQAKKHDKG